MKVHRFGYAGSLTDRMNSQKNNILFLSFTRHVGGAEISTLLLLKHMDKTRWNPTYMLPAEGPLSRRSRSAGVDVEIMPLDIIKLPIPHCYVRTVWKLAGHIRRNRIDLLVCSHELCNQYGLPAARLNRIPIACHTRNLIPDRRSFRRMFLEYPDILIANSNATAESYRAHMRNGQRVEVVYNGVDTGEYSPRIDDGRFRKKHGIGDDVYVVGVVARICKYKKQHVFIRAMAEVLKRQPAACALVAGETKIDGSDDYFRELRKMVRDLKIEGKVIFAGFIDDMKELYAALDLLVLPTMAEPFGRVLIEAMAMEKPVVATKAGGAVEVVDDGVSGLLIPPDDHRAMSDSILRMMEKKIVRKEMGTAGRERVVRKFSMEKNVNATQQIYQRLIQESIGGEQRS